MKRFLVFLVVVAAGVVAMAFTVPATAATVNGAKISQATFESQLSALNGSKTFQCLLTAQEAVRSSGSEALPGTSGAGSGTSNTTFASYWLDQDITAQVAVQLAAQRGVSPSPAELASARRDLISSYQSALQDVEGSSYACTTDPAAFVASLPSSLVASQVQLEATTEALLADSSDGVSAAAIAAYYAADRSQFNSICVSVIALSSEADATKVRAQILAGTPFAEAAAQSSLDPTSVAKGGAIGCFSPTSSEYSSLSSAVSGLAIGQPSQVLQNQEGDYLLFAVTKRTPAALGSVHSLVRSAVLQARQKRVNALLTAATRHSDISVDPRYGRWTVASATRGLLPPLSPPAPSVLDAAANEPPSSKSVPSAASGAGSAATGSAGSAGSGANG